MKHSQLNSSRIARYFAYFLLLTLFLLGNLVMIGWLTYSEHIIQVSSDYVPMQFNTALTFVLITLGILSMEANNKLAARIIGGVVILSGAVVLLEYLFSLDLGIDELFIKHYIVVESAKPGRMAPNTALGFIISGFSILWSSIGSYTSRKAVILIFINFALLILGYVAFMGYCLGASTISRWGHATNMAWHTALGFILWAVAFITLSIVEIKERGYQPKVYFTILSFLLCSFFFTVMWQISIIHEAHVLKNVLYSVSGDIRKKFDNKITTEFYALIRLKNRTPVTSPGNWQKDVRLYLKHHDSMDLIGQVRADNSLSQSYYKEAISFDLQSLKNTLKLMSLNQHSINIVPVRLAGKVYICAFFPINETGYLLTLYNVDALTKSLLSKDAYQKYNIEIRLNNYPVANIENDSSVSLKRQWGALQDLKLYGANFQFLVWPSWSMLSQYKSLTPNIIILAGLILSTLISVLISQRQMLVQSNKNLKALNQDLESFSYSIAHNLKAPLRHISGYIHLLDRHIPANSKKDIEKYMSNITQSADKMGLLIDSLLKYSSLSQVKLNKEWLSLNEVIETVIGTFTDEACAQVQWSIDPLPAIYADKVLLEMLFSELFTNAMTFADAERELKVKVSAISDKQGVHVTVKDNGIGFTAKYLKKAFLLFHQLSEQANSQAVGSGLAYVKKIVERHKGKIQFESNVNEGTVLHIFFPKHDI